MALLYRAAGPAASGHTPVLRIAATLDRTIEKHSMESIAVPSLNLLLRGGSVLLLALIAALLWRDQRRNVAARLGAAFAIGVAAATLSAMPGFGALPTLLRAMISAVAAGSMFVFWLFTRALLDDAFALRRWHGAVWAALAALGVLSCLAIAPRGSALAASLAGAMGLFPVFWSLLAMAQSLARWREDLVEGRRRLRAVIVAATALYTIGQPLAALLTGLELKAIVASSANAAGIAALTVFFAWQLLQWRGNVLFEGAQESVAPRPATSAPPPDARQVATLQALMTVQRVYREPSLTVAALALRMGLPEHRLRRLINQGLGHRHFSAFLNAYRIADAKQALLDPRQADVPVLTIAMDVGFQSIGPFNRAFKADTGLTPTEYRRTGAAHTDDPAAESAPELAET
jgi:AraC-like DNA-binding protein